MKKRVLAYATRAWVHFDEGLGINAMPLVFREFFGMIELWYFFPGMGLKKGFGIGAGGFGIAPEATVHENRALVISFFYKSPPDVKRYFNLNPHLCIYTYMKSSCEHSCRYSGNM